ncbi:MAG: hypothetical protein JXB09_05630 [Deltaproteobacteria bacterium]|nr:hypothetical protein [Deltaproteobacteria bacterium]
MASLLPADNRSFSDTGFGLKAPGLSTDQKEGESENRDERVALKETGC